ncbi:MAG: murein biosynthesis integral membrane protein MurJ [bacterium]
MPEEKQITRSAGVIGLSTLLSRVFGLVRDMLMSFVFGTGIVAEAFYVAFMIPNLLRRLVGEGSLTIAFISVFTKVRQEEGEEEARRLAATFWLFMTVVLAGLTALGMAFSREITALFTSAEYQAVPYQFDLAADMTRELFPYLFLIGLVAVSMGILNSYRHFFAPAFAPVLLNVCWIAAVVLLHGPLGDSGLSAMIGVLAGGVVQLLLQVPFLWRITKGVWLGINFRHPALRRIGALMVPSAFAMGVIQINTLVATYFVTQFPGGRSQLYYSTRLTEFPYAIFTLAVSTAVLPFLSEQAGRKDSEALAGTMSYGLRLVAFIIIPASVGLAVISTPLIHLIYEHGSFTAVDTSRTAMMLVMACTGLWAVAGVRIVAQVFYAVEDMVTPLVAASAALVVNAACCFGFSILIGRSGVPLAIAVAAIANFLVLAFRLRSKVSGIPGKQVASTVLKSIIASVPMALFVLALNRLSIWDQSGVLHVKIPVLAAQVAGGAVIYMAVAWILKARELSSVADIVKRRMGGGR